VDRELVCERIQREGLQRLAEHDEIRDAITNSTTCRIRKRIRGCVESDRERISARSCYVERVTPVTRSGVDRRQRERSGELGQLTDVDVEEALADELSHAIDAIGVAYYPSLGRSSYIGGDEVNFNSVLIGSEDPKRLTDYYIKLFGKPAMEDSGYSGWQIGNGWITVGPHDQIKGRNPQPGRLILNIESADVKGEFAKLKAAGANVVREPYNMEGWPPNTWVATLADPDDNYFQLVSPM
jgi:predicted enzyme related to lactoylglutathione lyase